MKYKQVTISTTHEFADIVSLCLCEAGSEGVNIFDAEDFKNALNDISWDYVDSGFLLNAPQAVLVSGFFDIGFDSSALVSELERLKIESEINTGSLETSCLIIESDDWENVWKKYYKPIKIGRVSVVPKWLKCTHKNTVQVFINPGMAFGTGSHETTSMCIRLMQETELEGSTAADIGCGSGILGICALKLGAKNCMFVDYDPNAVKAAHENCGYNGVTEKSEIVLGSLLEKETKQFDVVFANLTADILIELYKTLDLHMKTGGKIIVSGIISSKLRLVKKTYSSAFRCLKTLSKGDWRAMLLEKM